MKKKKENAIYQILLTSCVVAAFITGIFSLIVSLITNHRLKDIEMKKYEYSLHDIRFEKLQEELEFFSKFKVYDNKFIYKFDTELEEYSANAVMDMMYDSLGEYITHLNLIGPYLSDEAMEILEKKGVANPNYLKKYSITITDINDGAEVNAAIQEHMNLVNDEFDKLTAQIISVISNDIYNDYVPK